MWSASRPLVAFDLIVSDAQGRVLVGRRRNRPARAAPGFVPGGRIHKDETLDAAFAPHRADAELGIAKLARSTARFEGVFEHHYTRQLSQGEPDVSTHYIVLAYSLALTGTAPARAARAAQRICLWLAPSELLAREDVHDNTKSLLPLTQSQTIGTMAESAPPDRDFATDCEFGKRAHQSRYSMIRAYRPELESLCDYAASPLVRDSFFAFLAVFSLRLPAGAARARPSAAPAHWLR
ncbi:NUDIX domain-containing protein [Paraburkholderia dipogonis]|uniref:NUDIX domain-containing protein n=1 Tax=Paraburkholderia dipogonis TaxID=1211383 RepID=UPI0035EBF2CF